MNTELLRELAALNGTLKIIDKFDEEAEELLEAMRDKEPEDVLEELADVFVMAWQIQIDYGFSTDDLKAIANAKVRRALRRHRG